MLSDIFWYGAMLLLVFVSLFLSLLKYYKKKSESSVLERIKELEGIMGNQQFLYGNLHSIKQYILLNSPMEAAQYLTEFTNLLKSLSNSSKQKHISLSQEIETVLLYLQLEKKRLGEEFVYFLEIDTNLNTELIQVKPLFAFKLIEELIHNQSNKMQLHLIIKKVGEKLKCKIENTPMATNFTIEVPTK
jgi:LytS/YehU family sensor histidine kinase